MATPSSAVRNFDAKIGRFSWPTTFQEAGRDRPRSDRLALQAAQEGAERREDRAQLGADHRGQSALITADANGPKHLVKAITRADLESSSRI